MSEYIERTLLRTNPVLNSSFEIGTTSWTGSGTQFTVTTRNGANVAQLAYSTALSNIVYQQFSAANPAGAVTISFDGAVLSSGVTLRAALYNTATGQYVASGNTNADANWSRHTVRVNAAQEWNQLRIIADASSARPAGTVLAQFDRVLIGEGTYFDGSYEEYFGHTSEEHRYYEFEGTVHNSVSYEYTGGFWAPDVLDSPATYYAPQKTKPYQEKFARSFDFEVSYGQEWVSLHDVENYKISADEYGNEQTQIRRIQAASPFYDGTFTLHTTKESVTESFGVYVYGQTQNEVTENILRLKDLLEQFRFQIRIRVGNHRETWYCESADYSVDRSHVYLHNNMAVVKVQVPRLPKKTEEIVL